MVRVENLGSSWSKVSKGPRTLCVISRDFSNSRQTRMGEGATWQIWTQGMKERTDRWRRSWKRFRAVFSTNKDLVGVLLYCPLYAKVKAERRLWQHLGQHSSHRRRSSTEGRLGRWTKERGELCLGSPALPRNWPLGGPALSAHQPGELGTHGHTETLPCSHSFLK